MRWAYFSNTFFRGYRFSGLLISIMSTLILFGCQSYTSNDVISDQEMDGSLYQQLGGKKAIKAVLYSMVSRLHRDDKLSELFFDVDDNELKNNLQDFICQLSGGGCDYHGANMLDIHTEMFITKAEFDRFVSLFIYSMQDANVPFTAQNKLLAKLAALREQVIEF